MRLFLCFASLALALAPALQGDAAKLARSKDATQRLAAVGLYAAEGGERAAKALQKLCGDEDWEVVESAARALGGLGQASALDTLVSLALEGAVERVRRAAAQAAAALDPGAATLALARKVRGKEGARACAALALVAPHAPAPKPPSGLDKLVDEKDARLRAAAARALVALAREERASVLAELCASSSIVVQAAALEAAAADPHPAQLGFLAELLGRPALVGVLERRAALAFRATLAALEDGADASRRAAARVRELAALPAPEAAARGARLALLLAREQWMDRAALEEALAPSLDHAAPAVRAAAARALAAFVSPSAAERARALAERDGSSRVRRAALSAWRAQRAALTAEEGAWLATLFARETEAQAREELAVLLGERELEAGLETLVAGLRDPDWAVGVACALSLGRTQLPAALEPLAALARSASDWRLRGGAVVGLAQMRSKSALPALIEALADAEPAVARTSHAFLLSVAGEEIAPEPALWRAWWQARAERVKVADPRDLEERRRRYGYAVPPKEIFAGLDVLVLESRGDRIELVLDFVGIPHRRTAAARVVRDGVDPAGVLVVNCTGEVEPADVERIAWFVRAGGSLFGSCWALSETIGRVAPGPMRKLETQAEVLDAVLASPCAPGSPYLEKVFAEGVQPIYALQGAHLIELVEPERVEVLIDSAECAERWGGGGELAAWFRAGHGLVLDSVNHFDVQGLELAAGLKEAEQRMAYAVDHMGLSYERLRATRAEKWWSSNQRAAREVRDLSVFELVTNFVRERRILGR